MSHPHQIKQATLIRSNKLPPSDLANKLPSSGQTSYHNQFKQATLIRSNKPPSSGQTSYHNQVKQNVKSPHHGDFFQLNSLCKEGESHSQNTVHFKWIYAHVSASQFSHRKAKLLCTKSCSKLPALLPVVHTT